jgi:hypothetical protein
MKKRITMKNPSNNHNRRHGVPSQAGMGIALPLILVLFLFFISPGILVRPVLSDEGNDTLNDSVSTPALSDTSIQIPVPTWLGTAAKTDGQIFAEICGCLSKRVTIRKDSPDFVPVSWSVRALNGKAVRPREERGGGSVVLDLAAYEPGVYVVTLVDKQGKTIARPLNVK